MREPSGSGDARDRVAPVVAETRFSGAIVWCSWPRSAAARLLPPPLRLDAPSSGGRKRHPVVFVFGEHDRSKVIYATIDISTGVRFPELLIFVPFVRRVGAPPADPSTFLAQAFSGEPVGTWSGNAHYGFTKRMAAMEWLGDRFVVADDHGALLIHAGAEAAGPWSRPRATTSPELRRVAELGALPVFGWRAGDELVLSHFEWRFDDAWTRPVRAVVSIDAALGPRLAPGRSRAWPGTGLEVAGMRWRLSWPSTAGRTACE